MWYLVIYFTVIASAGTPGVGASAFTFPLTYASEERCLVAAEQASLDHSVDGGSARMVAVARCVRRF